MNQTNKENLESVIEALELVPVEVKTTILGSLDNIQAEPDELITATLSAIRKVLGEDFKIIT